MNSVKIKINLHLKIKYYVVVPPVTFPSFAAANPKPPATDNNAAPVSGVILPVCVNPAMMIEANPARLVFQFFNMCFI